MHDGDTGLYNKNWHIVTDCTSIKKKTKKRKFWFILKLCSTAYRVKLAYNAKLMKVQNT